MNESLPQVYARVGLVLLRRWRRVRGRIGSLSPPIWKPEIAKPGIESLDLDSLPLMSAARSDEKVGGAPLQLRTARGRGECSEAHISSPISHRSALRLRPGGPGTSAGDAGWRADSGRAER